MNDSRKTKAQLVEELQQLRKRLAKHETASNRPKLEPEQLERFAAHGAWLVDTDFVVRVANEAMCRVLDKTPDEVLGRKCYELIDGPGCHSEACNMRRAFAGSCAVTGHEERTPVGRAPLTCRVVAHLVHDRSQEVVGVVEHLEETAGVDLPASEIPVREPSSFASPQPASEASAKLAEVALQVARSLRSRLSDDECAKRGIDALEEACAPWNGRRPRAKTTVREHAGKPELHEVGPHRSVLIVAPPTSQVRSAWADVVRRAGYALLTAGEEREPADSMNAGPTVAILDLALGEPATDELHTRLRRDYPNMPIFVVSSSTSDALEARRWRRACTWYVPRAAGGDELVRLIEDVSPRPVLRSRPEH